MLTCFMKFCPGLELQHPITNYLCKCHWKRTFNEKHQCSRNFEKPELKCSTKKRPSYLLKPLDTFGKQYCPRPALRVSQLIYKITNMWKFRLKIKNLYLHRKPQRRWTLCYWTLCFNDMRKKNFNMNLPHWILQINTKKKCKCSSYQMSGKYTSPH